MNFYLLKTSLSILIFTSILSLSSSLQGQTNPTPFDLSAGSYEFTAWDSLSPAGTFPPSMVFHYVAANQTAPFYTDGSFDFNCSYKKSKRSRINGLMNYGIGIVTTSSSQYNDCNSGAADSRFMGAVLLSLNASGRNNIKVSWESETVIPGDGSSTEPRIWNLRLQYRVGESGLYTDMPGPIEFISSISTGDSVQFSPATLPSECNNQPTVQLRWIYFETSVGIAGGSRPQLRLDNIEVTSDQTVGLSETLADKSNLLSIFPNPAHTEFSLITNSDSKGNLQVTDQIGRLVMQKSFNHVLTSFDCSNLPKGIYFVRVTDNSNGSVKTNKLIIR